MGKDRCFLWPVAIHKVVQGYDYVPSDTNFNDKYGEIRQLLRSALFVKPNPPR